MTEDLLTLNIVAFVVLVTGLVASLTYVKLTAQRAREWKQLAEVRDERIDHLEAEQLQMKKDLAELRGALAATQALKVEEITAGVVEAISPLLDSTLNG